MIQAIEASIQQLQADCFPFLDVQRERLKERHLEVERQCELLKHRRKAAINLQRRLYLEMKNKAAPSVFLNIKDDFEIHILAGIQKHTTTIGFLRKDLCTTSVLGIIFSGRHLLGETGRTHAWFFDRPSPEMKRCLESPSLAENEYLGKQLCGMEHLTFHTLDVKDEIIIPSETNDQDYESGIPGLEITVAKGSNIDIDLINLAETICARADAILNTISTRYSANLKYLQRRERAVIDETKRVNKIEKHLRQAADNWKLELQIAAKYRRWSESAILVNMGTLQDRLQRGVIEQVLTTTDTLLLVAGSALSKMIEKSRAEALHEETARRWGIETISIPISSPESVWSFRRCLLYLHLEWPKAPEMPKHKTDRKRLWKAAANFGIITRNWSKWFNYIEPDEQWDLHYSDLTFEEHSKNLDSVGGFESTGEKK
jgi:hypothetical protein